MERILVAVKYDVVPKKERKKERNGGGWTIIGSSSCSK